MAGTGHARKKEVDYIADLLWLFEDNGYNWGFGFMVISIDPQVGCYQNMEPLVMWMMGASEMNWFRVSRLHPAHLI